MLDMSVRAKILQLMLDLKASLDLTYVYITHDLASAKFFCDRIAIMYLGRIVEIGPTDEIFDNPKHPYTKALLAAIPDPDPSRALPRDLLKGEIPDAARPPRGCSFHPRCSVAFDACGWETRDLKELLENHWAALSPDEYERERALVPDVDPLNEPGTKIELPTAKGRAPELKTTLDRLHADDPSEPFWRGVESIQATADTLDVSWHEPIEPRLVESGRVEVACHLYDDDALKAAEQYRETAAQSRSSTRDA